MIFNSLVRGRGTRNYSRGVATEGFRVKWSSNCAGTISDLVHIVPHLTVKPEMSVCLFVRYLLRRLRTDRQNFRISQSISESIISQIRGRAYMAT